MFSANRDMMPSYHPKGVSVERSTFNSRSDFSKYRTYPRKNFAPSTVTSIFQLDNRIYVLFTKQIT